MVQQTSSRDRLPGILLAWRLSAKHYRTHAWEGYVVFARPGIVAHDGGEADVMIEWVSADRIKPY